jgi:hypothetical protein
MTFFSISIYSKAFGPTKLVIKMADVQATFDLTIFVLRTFVLRTFVLRTFVLRTFVLRTFVLRTFVLRTFVLTPFVLATFDPVTFGLTISTSLKGLFTRESDFALG